MQLRIPLTLKPTACSMEYSEVDFIKGGRGSSGRAESPHQAVLQEGELSQMFLALVCLVLFFFLASGKFFYLILSLLSQMVGLD